MILLYVLLPCCLFWSVAQSFLYYRGHYPTHLLPLQALIACGTSWLGFDAVQRDGWLFFVGFLVPIAASVSIVFVVLKEVRGIEVLAVLQVLGYVDLCVAFCLSNAVVSACVCGACLSLVGVYSYKLVETSDDTSYLIHI